MPCISSTAQNPVPFDFFFQEIGLVQEKDNANAGEGLVVDDDFEDVERFS